MLRSQQPSIVPTASTHQLTSVVQQSLLHLLALLLLECSRCGVGALVDQAVAALILPSNNIELAGGVPEPRAGAAGTADGRAQVVQAMA